MTDNSIWFAARKAQADASDAAVTRGFPNLVVEPVQDARRSTDQLRAWQLATRPDLTPTPPAGGETR